MIKKVKKKKITNIAEGSDAIIEIRSMFKNIHANILERSLAESTSVNPKKRKKFKLRAESWNQIYLQESHKSIVRTLDNSFMYFFFGEDE